MTTTSSYLERIDHGRNMARYYRLSVVKTLFGDWAMVREWGRIGRRGQSREHWCGSVEQATTLLEQHQREREKRGYSPMLSDVGKSQDEADRSKSNPASPGDYRRHPLRKEEVSG